MPTAHEYIKYQKGPTIIKKIIDALTLRDGTTTRRGTTPTSRRKFCCKNGAPATDTAGDAPYALGDICYDSLNDDVYVCTAFVSDTSFTWTKINA